MVKLTYNISGSVIFMSGKICCFSGHRLVLDGNVKERVEMKVEELVCEGFTEFYSGGMGEFDGICENAVRRIKQKDKKIKLRLILPYMKTSVNRDREYYESSYDEIIIPDIGGVHYKRAITVRNRWIAERADVVLAYVIRDFGGAYDMCRYAEKIGKRVIYV